MAAVFTSVPFAEGLGSTPQWLRTTPSAFFDKSDTCLYQSNKLISHDSKQKWQLQGIATRGRFKMPVILRINTRPIMHQSGTIKCQYSPAMHVSY